MLENKFKNVCRDFMNGKCNYNPCRFIHDPELCKNFYANNCDGKCNKNHFLNQKLIVIKNPNPNPNSNKKKSRPTNTESFKPNFSPPEMRVLFQNGQDKTKIIPQSNDLVIVPDLFASDTNLYDKLLGEIFATNFDKQELVIPWHEGSHLIMDDNLDWKKSCPMFNYVVNKVAKYFNMDVKATRFNWMQNLNDHKFFHYDGAALKPEIAKKQNSTIGISFGYTRDIAFQVASHPDCRKVVSFELPNGYTYCFNKDVNIDWRHGILPIKTNPDYKPEPSHGRISIIVWGWINQLDIKPHNHI